ncbi:ATP-binding protein [Methylobacterium sp. NEAU 140]|uniref:ATP-binding protein n=1 Tax=Methylobacterium sp. NEAU 140 TaxID=3064945 RepID=UPI0027336CF3|nr:ATP-binding protein [Methylobacterium sp. NEAU 140]MDP4022046.1 ATP-binding protein [Methylobacterium sp. NEAU 140]
MRKNKVIFFARQPNSRIAERVHGTVSGFSLIARLHLQLETLRDTDVIVDLTGVDRIDGHLTPCLQAVVNRAAINGNTIRLAKVASAIHSTFCKNRFVVEERIDRHNTVMPVTTFSVDGGKEFAVYAKKYLSRPEMPRMTISLREKLHEGIGELFENSAMHSRTKAPIIVGGQFYPTKNWISMSIVDIGQGIQRAVSAKLGINLTPQDAIGWAMEPFNTTKDGDVPGGLGSKILREFIEKNKGKITVVSNNGYWSQYGTNVTKRRLPMAFPGTAVVLEINSSDRQSYELKVSPDPYSIW